jgi:hypothetical protein
MGTIILFIVLFVAIWFLSKLASNYRECNEKQQAYQKSCEDFFHFCNPIMARPMNEVKEKWNEANSKYNEYLDVLQKDEFE